MGKPWSRACPGASEMHQKGTCVGPNRFPCELVSVRGKNAVEMHGPGTLPRGTEAAARFILSIQMASPIPKKRIALALGEWTGAPSSFARPHAPLSPFAPGFRCPVSRLPAKTCKFSTEEAPFRPSCAPLLGRGAMMPMPGRPSIYI